MNAAMLVLTVIGIVAAGAAAVFAYPSWQQYRKAPVLRAEPLGQIISKHVTATEREIHFQLALVNEGPGAARNWRVRLTTPGMPPGYIQTPGLDAGRGHVQYKARDGRVVVEWWAVDESDAVPPGQTRPLATPCIARVAYDELVGEFALTADRSSDIGGAIAVRHSFADVGDVTFITRATTRPIRESRL